MTGVPAYKPSVLGDDARVDVAIDFHPTDAIESLMSMLDGGKEVREAQRLLKVRVLV